MPKTGRKAKPKREREHAVNYIPTPEELRERCERERLESLREKRENSAENPQPSLRMSRYRGFSVTRKGGRRTRIA